MGQLLRSVHAAYAILRHMYTTCSRWVMSAVCRARASSRLHGFTIVETMIVLAVTGLLFVAIAATLNGRINSAEFVHAVETLQVQIQDKIDATADGYYVNGYNFSCRNSNGKVSLGFGTGNNSRGTNQACIYLGRVIQFGVQGTHPEEYRIYAVAGLRGPTNGPKSPFSNVNPTIVWDQGAFGGNFRDYSAAAGLEYGLTTAWVRVGLVDIGAVAFLVEPGNFGATSYNSGAEPLDLVPIPGSLLQRSPRTEIPIIDSKLNDPNLTSDAPLNPPAGVQICVVSGSNSQSALLTIGRLSTNLHVTLDIKGNKTCS